MKYLYLFIISFLFGVLLAQLANAQECSSESKTETKTISTEVPKALQGALIVVMTTDGSTYHMDADEYKVVPRKRQEIITKETRTCAAAAVKTKILKNRLSALLGQGPTGHLKAESDGANAEVESQVDLVGGLQYQRMINGKGAVLGVQIQTNETVMGTIGSDF